MDQTIYYGGDILTMEGKPEDTMPEAVLVKDGCIAALGNKEDLMAREPKSRLEDLSGHTLMPAFIDPHSHFSGYAYGVLQVSLSETADFQEIIDRIRNFIKKNHVPKGKWVQAGGYDQNALAEGRHPDRKVLDAAAPDNPLLIKHQSGHMGVLNSLGIQNLGLTPETKSPEGGRIGIEDGELTGYLEENALMKYMTQIPGEPKDALLKAFDTAQAAYASYGICTAQEGMMPAGLAPLYQGLMAMDKLYLDIVAYEDMKDIEKLETVFSDHLNGYKDHFRIGGYKMFLDGSPQGRTAWMREPYEDSPDYQGYPTLSDEQVYEKVCLAAANGRQILAHCNGDAAADQYLRMCSRVAEEYGSIRDIRPVMVHAQLLGRDQLDEVKRLGILPSFFVAHVKYWGDVHVKNFGEKRAQHISPAGSALKKHIPFTFHQDSPVIEPNMLETVGCAVNRRTKTGRLLGADECIPVWEALKAVTINAAWQYFEEDTKGSLRPGKRADLVILDQDPLRVEPEMIGQIQVLETIKDGKTIYKQEK